MLWIINKKVIQIEENNIPVLRRLDPELDMWLGLDGREDAFSEDFEKDLVEEVGANLYYGLKPGTPILVIQQSCLYRNPPENTGRVIGLGKLESVLRNQHGWTYLQFQKNDFYYLNQGVIRMGRDGFNTRNHDMSFYINDDTVEILELSKEQYDKLLDFYRQCTMEEFINYRKYGI